MREQGTLRLCEWVSLTGIGERCGIAGRMAAVEQYLKGRMAAAASPEEAAVLEQLHALWSKRLWHQLTGVLVDALARKGLLSKQIELYHACISDFANKLNAVEFAKMVKIIAANECASPEDALAFIAPHLEPKSVIMGNPEARVLLLSEASQLRLLNQEPLVARSLTDQARSLVSASADMANEIQAAYYAALASYHKQVGTAAEFYHNALMFLAYSDVPDMPRDLRVQWAFDLAVAALVGKEIFSFGELLLHQVVRDMQDTGHAWLVQLLKALETGDLDKFNRICDESSAKMGAQPALVANADFLRQKVTIMALLNLAFERITERRISFAEIATRCRLPTSEVEFLLMRAMSLKLITGIIDGVESYVTVSHIVPRVIDRTQSADMAQRLDLWCKSVSKTLEFMEGETADLFA